MSPTGVARWAMMANAAKWKKRAFIGAAVKTTVSGQRNKGGFGNRKPARSDNPKVGGSNPPPENQIKNPVILTGFFHFKCFISSINPII